jgi:photosystem II stability/assembly factor-like uncharacterized protein
MTKRFILPVATGAALVIACAALWASNEPISDWKIAGPFGGTARSIALDPEKPEVLLAGAMNSLLFRTQDAGATWNLLNFPKRNLSEVTSVLVDPRASKHYLAGIVSADGGGLYESHDEGVTWATVNGIKDFGVRALAAAPSDPTRIVAGTAHGVMQSNDSGVTWARISDPQNFEMQGITAVAIDPKDPAIIYAGTSHLPWKTLDGGKNWQSIHTGMIDDSDVFSIYIDPAKPTDVFASACSGIYATADRGDQWKKLMGLSLAQRRTHVIRKDPATTGTLYAGTTMGLFKSPNSGATWRPVTNTQVNSMVFDPAKAGGMFLAMEYEGVGMSNDGADNVKMINNGFVDRSISAVAQSGERLMAVEPQLAETSGIFFSRDRGENWAQMKDVKGLSGVHLTGIAGSVANERILIASSPRQLYKSIDGGTIWKPIALRVIVPPAPEPVPAKTATKVPVKTTPAKGAAAKPPVKRAVVRKPLEKLRIATPSQFVALYSFKDGATEVFFAATDLGLFKSTDAGEKWTLADMQGSIGVSALFAAANSDGRLIAKASGGLFESKDFGAQWAPLAFPLPSSDVNSVALSNDKTTPLLVATRLGLYASPDDGAQWNNNLSGIPASTVSSVVYRPDNIAYAVAYGRLYQTNGQTSASNVTWNIVPSALPATRIRQLWIPDSSGRLYGITNDLGILFRN